MKLEGYRIIPHEISKSSRSERFRAFEEHTLPVVRGIKSGLAANILGDQAFLFYAIKCFDEVANKNPIYGGFSSLLDVLNKSKNTEIANTPESVLYKLLEIATQPNAEKNEPAIFDCVQNLKRVAETYDGKKPPIYVMQSDFFKKLAETDATEVPLELFPKTFKGYISFEKGILNTIIHSGSLKGVEADVIGAYVNVKERSDGRNRISVLFMLETSEGHIVETILQIPDWAEKIKSGIHNAFEKRGITADYDYSLMDAICLAVVYISCGNPDLRVLKASSKVPTSAMRGMINRGVNVEEEYSEDIADDVTLVSWSWKKDPLYTKGKWGVRAFFRVQRFGPGLAQSRIIWIAPHLAHRRKDLLTSNDDSSDPKAGNPIDFDFIFGDLYE